MSNHSLVKTKDVIGVDVTNPTGENLGEIEEIVLNKLSGQVNYVVLSFGGFLGVGDKLFALPWKSLHFDANTEKFILNIDKDKIKNAPGFNKENWPNFADPTWEKGIVDYYRI